MRPASEVAALVGKTAILSFAHGLLHGGVRDPRGSSPGLSARRRSSDIVILTLTGFIARWDGGRDVLAQAIFLCVEQMSLSGWYLALRPRSSVSAPITQSSSATRRQRRRAAAWGPVFTVHKVQAAARPMRTRQAFGPVCR
jgi:hypothetical protein